MSLRKIITCDNGDAGKGRHKKTTEAMATVGGDHAAKADGSRDDDADARGARGYGQWCGGGIRVRIVAY